MIKSINESEFIAITSFEAYQQFALSVFSEMKNSKAYLSKDKIVFYIGSLQLSDDMFFHYEATIKKLENGLDDFSFVRMVLTDDLDFTLDRINESRPYFRPDQIHFPNDR